VYFGTYALAQRVLQRDQDSPWTTTQATLAGAISGITGTFVVGPTELVKIRVQVGKEEATSGELRRTLHTAQKIYTTEGLMGFSKGFNVTLLREIPCIAIYFGMYDFCKKKLRSNNGNLSILGQLFAGGFAGSSSWVITYPLDVLKTRIQADPTQRSIASCAANVWQAKGIRGFYSGVLPCGIRAFPVNAVIFAIYEWCMKVARR